MTKLEKFILKSTSKFGTRFDYSKVIYTTSETKVTIGCAVHGDIEVAPYTFLHSREGCQLCSRANMSNKWTTEKFIEKSVALFGNVFDYTDTVYTGSKKYLNIKCLVHGVFTQRPEKHLTSKHGCPKCASATTRAQLTKTTAEFIRKATSLHGTKYDYSGVKYTSYKDSVVITCNKCHTSFNQSPNSHMNGSGCPVCSTSGFDVTKPAILYYLRINNGEAYKIGITNRTVTERFNLTDLKSLDVVDTLELSSGAVCLEKERAILKEYAEHKYTGTSLLASGNTELFNKDVLCGTLKEYDEVQST